MPYLKDKIAKAVAKSLQVSQTSSFIKTEPIEIISQPLKPQIIFENKPVKTSKKAAKAQAQSSPAQLQAKKSSNSAKNIVKNFGRAMVTFAISKVAVAYIEDKLKVHNLSYQAFHRYLFQRKENMDGISSLRGLILIESHDDD